MPGQSVTYTWTNRELPILQAALRRVDAGEMNPTLDDIRTEVGLEVDQIQIAVDALEDADYLELRRAGVQRDEWRTRPSSTLPIQA
jgi:hypothetical protein